MLIYEESRLKWAAQLAEIPIAIDRSNLDGLPGAIVTLGRTGSIQASYLGSEPLLFKVPPLNLQAMDFEKTQLELIELEKDIKSGVDFTDMSLINSSAEHDLSIQLAVNSILEACTFPTNSWDMPLDNEGRKMCSVSLGLKATVALEQIQVHFYVEPPLKCSDSVWMYQDVTADSVENLNTFVYFSDNLVASSAKITAVVSFINKKSIPRVIRKTGNLPLPMFCKLGNPQKDASNKITIAVENADVPSMEVLYPEFALDFNTSGAVGFKMFQSDSVVTIVSGKNSNRYR